MFPNGNPNRIILVACLLIGGFIFFGILSLVGKKYCEFVIKKQKETDTTNTDSMDHSATENEKSFENNIEWDSNLRKVSLGAQAARKV